MLCSCYLNKLIINIAKSEQSSHTPGSGLQRLYHFNWKEKNGQIKGLISNMWLNFLYTVQLVISDFVPNFKILGQVVPEKSLMKISIFIS